MNARIQVITNDHDEVFFDYLDSCQKRIRIISPFLSVPMADRLCKNMNSSVTCSFITRLYIEDLYNRANSIEAIRMMMESGIDVYAVKGLHTKLYLFDDDKAIIGSANFTSGGFKSNIELSLALENEPVIDELRKYFDDMLIEVNDLDGIVTKAILDDADDRLTSLFGGKKDKGHTTSVKMYGADIGLLGAYFDGDEQIKEVRSGETESNDYVTSLFKNMVVHEQITYDHNIWMKFNGRAENRHNPDDIAQIFCIEENGKTLYLSNYPKAPSVKDNDEVYFASLTTDTRGKNQPVIVARGILEGYDSFNIAPERWLEKAPWMDRYPHYCVVKTCEVLNIPNKQGIPLDAILNELGSDTYVSSFGKNENPSEIGKKHFQKAHIRITGNAKLIIDKRFDALSEKYGSTIVSSER